MDRDLYTNIGYFLVLCMKYIFIPIIVGVAIRVISGKLLQPQPERQMKKPSRSVRNQDENYLKFPAVL